MKTLKRKWLIYAISGLVVFGFGLSLLGEANIEKLQRPDSWHWVVYGTIALIVTNSGLCLFGQAVVLRVQMLTK
ncbi:MAG: hypothetical protein NXI20_13055 [bacterium]|nr:hypothetical protein [bacterium]